VYLVRSSISFQITAITLSFGVLQIQNQNGVNGMAKCAVQHLYCSHHHDGLPVNLLERIVILWVIVAQTALLTPSCTATAYMCRRCAGHIVDQSKSCPLLP
jgi:hypothetical protein